MKKSDLILLLLHGDNKYPIDGITKFIKLVFLAQKEVLDISESSDSKFKFGPDRFGPLSMEIYDELAFLNGVGMINEVGNKKYEITTKGVRFLEMKTFGRVDENVRKQISKIKEVHGKENLNALLKYVYTTYPEFTTNSEILDKVLNY